MNAECLQALCRLENAGFWSAPSSGKVTCSVSHGVLGHEATTHVLNVIVFEIKLNHLLVSMMPSLPLPDGEHLEAFAIIVGTKPG